MEVIAIEDGRHSVVDRPQRVVRLGDDNRAALDPFAIGTVPAFPEAAKANGRSSATVMKNGCFRPVSVFAHS
jgi:hypothetical protein